MEVRDTAYCKVLQKKVAQIFESPLQQTCPGKPPDLYQTGTRMSNAFTSVIKYLKFWGYLLLQKVPEIWGL